MHSFAIITSALRGYAVVTAPQRQFWFDSLAARQDVSSNAYRVATVIGFAVFVGKDSCYLSYEVIAERSPFSRRAVIKIVKELEAAGWIAVRRTMGRRANTFMLTLPPPLLFPDANGEQICSPLDAVERCTGSAAVDANSEQVGSPLELQEQCTSPCTDADEQQCTDVAPTVHELVHPKRRKEIITYNPLGAEDGKHTALFERLWTLWGGGGFEDRARRRLDKTLRDGVDPAVIIAAAERRRKRLDQFELQDAGRLYLWLRRGDWQREPGVPQQVFVECDTKPGRAWEDFWLRTKRKRPNWFTSPAQGFRRGRYFPTEFPPDDSQG